MSDSPLRNLLTQLHHTLEGSGPITDEDRQLLRQLSADIQDALAEPGSPREGGSLVDRLQGSITRFEVSHPELSAAMLQASKQLGDMGI